MTVLRFSEDNANYVEWGDHAFFVYRAPGGRYQLLQAQCPHRGGPLFLGEPVSGGRESIRCPWHDTVVAVAWLARKSPAMVVNRGRFTVVVTEAEGERPRARRVPNLTRQDGPHGGSASPGCTGRCTTPTAGDRHAEP
jgi:nitrite reductase (NADH) small subunit